MTWLNLWPYLLLDWTIHAYCLCVFRPLDVHGHPASGGGTEGNRGRRKAPKTFAFDHCFWSMDKDNPKFASKSNVPAILLIWSCGIDELFLILKILKKQNSKNTTFERLMED